MFLLRIVSTFSAMTVSMLYAQSSIVFFSSKMPRSENFTALGVIMSPVETSMERCVSIVSSTAVKAARYPP
jgi:hypothetical protein